MLIRLAAVGVLWDLSRRSSKNIRISILGVGVVALVCLLAAIGGGAAMRHRNAAATPGISQ
jgi:hypothetical protein